MIKEHESLPTSQSSNIVLDLHTEIPYSSQFSPDFLLLFCLRSDRDKEALTLVSSAREFLKDLDEDTIEELYKQDYRTDVDISFGASTYDRSHGPTVQILYGDRNDPVMIYDRDLTVGLTGQAQKALNKLQSAASDNLTKIKLEPGDLLMVDNRRAIHGRNDFKAYFDGYDRWLQRLFVCRNLTQADVIYSKHQRIIDHDFAVKEM